MVALLKGEQALLQSGNIRNDNWLQRVLLSWVYGVVYRGKVQTLDPSELKMPGDQATDVALQKFDKHWLEELELHKQGKQASLARALRRSYGREFLIAGVWKMLWSCFVILGAFYFTRALIDYVKPLKKDHNMYNSAKVANDGVGWILSIAFFIDSWLVGLSLQRMADCTVRLGIKARAVLMTSVYRKTFKLANAHGDQNNIVALVATDCQKVYNGCQALHNVWTAPIETAAIIALLLWLTGKFGLPALGVIVFILPLQYYFGYLITQYKLENVRISESRVTRMHEILLAIKLVKFYVWEKSFASQVAEVRKQELRLIAKAAMIKVLNLCLVFAIPPVIAIVIYSTYAFAKGRMDAATAFTVLSLFNTLRFPLVVLPKALRGSTEAISSVKRLQAFLLLPETDETKRSAAVEAHIEDATLVYGTNEVDEFKLQVKHFDAFPGEVVAVVGRVGCGKSSLFNAILGNMVVQTGTVKVGGKIAYVPQTPWVQNLTLRDNILFGLPYDEDRYNKVVHACALELDFTILPKGDSSMAGERGINLSGGQRQRLCLARAAYHDCELVLMDNPLSAVDQHTAKHIFDHCIKGMMKDKAVILITHQLELLPLCTKVGIIEEGKLVTFGPYQAEVMSAHMPVDHLLFATVEAGDAAAKKPEHPPSEAEPEQPAQVSITRRKSMQRSSCGGMHPISSVELALNELGAQAAEEEERQMVIVEEAADQSPEDIARLFNGIPKRLTAAQSLRVYIRAGGVALFCFSIFIFATTQTMRVYSDYWIRLWSADYYGYYSKHSQDEASQIYILAYMAFVIMFIFLLLARDSLFCAFTLITSTRLHNKLFNRVLEAPILFFLRTPVGDVLNAFAKDQDTIDETLVDTMHMSIIYLMILLTTLAIVTVNLHYYACMAGFLAIVFFIMQYLYLPAATLLKRWAGETASQVYVHVDESLHGMDLIRAFDAVDYFIQDCIQRVNVHHLALFNTEQTHIWLAFWCDLFGAILVVVTALMSVGLKHDVPPAAVGLALSNCIQLLVFFTWVVRGMADSVSMWDSVERITTFATMVPSELECIHDTPATGSPASAPAAKKGAGGDEAAAQKPGDTLKPWVSPAAEASGASALIVVKVDNVQAPLDPGQWPTKGDVRFECVCLRYFPGAPLALRGVSFHIQDKEKIGVVGRTGSGKTTLLMALFRMFELAGGRIVLDGVDIASQPLQEVRRRIAIIPQEPVMFKGSMRTNLDPFGASSDAQLWDALQMVHMKDAIAALPGGLDASVTEGGTNFSLGQKQLVCMARCVLKDTRLLVLDEATAAMDLQTDALVQRTIRKVFKERTTLTIAHRLDTIIFSDRIIAMSSGQMKEFDVPMRLLKNPKSMFASLVDDTGALASATLRKMAADGPQDEK